MCGCAIEIHICIHTPIENEISGTYVDAYIHGGDAHNHDDDGNNADTNNDNKDIVPKR